MPSLALNKAFALDLRSESVGSAVHSTAIIQASQAQRWAKIFQMLWPQAFSTTKIASPMALFRGTSEQATIGFHVADFGLDRASPAKVDDFTGRQPSACAADQDTGLPFVMNSCSRDQRRQAQGAYL